MKKILVSIALAALGYLVCAMILFHDVLAPPGFVFFWNDRLQPQYWRGAAIAGLLIAGIAATVTALYSKGRVFAPAVFVGIAMIFSISVTAATVDETRRRAVAEFKPDRVIQNSFWRSLREAPREYQFYLHAAALKDCIPYAWSYRQMAFYRLPPNVAVNVLPDEWLSMCQIHRN